VVNSAARRAQPVSPGQGNYPHASGPGPAAGGAGGALAHAGARGGGGEMTKACPEITSIWRDNPASIAYPDTSIIQSFPSYAVLRARESTTAIMPMIKTSLSAMPYQSGV